MGALSNLFNAHATGSEAEQRIAERNFKIWKEQGQEQARIGTISKIVSGCDITEKVKGTGFNLYVRREEGETNKEWLSRSQDTAASLSKIMSGVTNANASKGRVILDVEENSEAHQVCVARTLGR